VARRRAITAARARLTPDHFIAKLAAAAAELTAEQREQLAELAAGPRAGSDAP
jgi:hypothetical protein